MLEKAKKKISSLLAAEKFKLAAAVLLTLALLIAVPATAWFTHKRSLSLMTEVNSPYSLHIAAGNKEDIVNLDLSEIDVEETDENNNPITSKDYVFCVVGNSSDEYKLQLAYTTNIGFEYELHKASETSGSGDVIYVSESGTEYCYTKAEKISGNYKNTSDGKLADSTQHTLTYGDYGNVQKNAEPVYWQSDSLAVSESSVDYYILTVNWDASFTNTKETDIIYITASRNVSD